MFDIVINGQTSSSSACVPSPCKARTKHGRHPTREQAGTKQNPATACRALAPHAPPPPPPCPGPGRPTRTAVAVVSDLVARDARAGRAGPSASGERDGPSWLPPASLAMAWLAFSIASHGPYHPIRAAGACAAIRAGPRGHACRCIIRRPPAGDSAPHETGARHDGGGADAAGEAGVRPRDRLATLPP